MQRLRALTTSLALAAGAPSTATTLSPPRSPARAAGLPLKTETMIGGT